MAFLDRLFKRNQGAENRNTADKNSDASSAEPSVSGKTDTEVLRTRAEESGRKIIEAIDTLLYTMKDKRKFPKLSSEDTEELAEQFQRMERVLDGMHCDYDVADLDFNILSLVGSLEGQMRDSDASEWKPVLQTLAAAIKDRITSELKVRAAALDVAECLIRLTNSASEKTQTMLEEACKDTADELIRISYEKQILAIKENRAVNKQRLETIQHSRFQLNDKASAASPEALKTIDEQLFAISQELPEALKILDLNTDFVKKHAVTFKTVTSEIDDVISKYEDTTGNILKQDQKQEDTVSVPQKTVEHRQEDVITD